MKGFKPDPDGIEAEVRKQQQRGADRVKATGEVFTPMPLCREMVAEIPLETKQDAYATFLDPSCGDGNFLVALLEELSKFHDPYWVWASPGLVDTDQGSARVSVRAAMNCCS